MLSIGESKKNLNDISSTEIKMSSRIDYHEEFRTKINTISIDNNSLQLFALKTIEIRTFFPD